MTLQARLEYVIGWLHMLAWRRGYGDPGHVSKLIHCLREWEDRRCHLVPLSLARYGLLEMNGERVAWRLDDMAHTVLRDSKTITVLPSDQYQHDAPIGTFRIRRFDPSRISWLVYR